MFPSKITKKRLMTYTYYLCNFKVFSRTPPSTVQRMVFFGTGAPEHCWGQRCPYHFHSLPWWGHNLKWMSSQSNGIKHHQSFKTKYDMIISNKQHREINRLYIIYWNFHEISTCLDCIHPKRLSFFVELDYIFPFGIEGGSSSSQGLHANIEL